MNLLAFTNRNILENNNRNKNTDLSKQLIVTEYASLKLFKIM